MTSEAGARAASPLPVGVHRASDYESLARERLPQPVFEYIAGGSGDGLTLDANRAAFLRRHSWPRVLRDVSAGSTRLQLAGRELAHPILLAPVAHQALVHPGAEAETARGAAAVDALMVLSTLSSRPLEDVAASASGPKWFQVYFQPRREDTLDLARRAQAAGYGALVVTVDAAIQVPSSRALRAGFSLPSHCVAANLVNYPRLQPGSSTAGAGRIFRDAMGAAPTWADLEWLMRCATLPVWVKGVLHPDDARRLRDLGVAGIVVSNHGGRTLDQVPASLEALPAVRAAVGADCPLLLDSGIRSGADVFQAIAHGADAVLVGRLPVYALAVAGALGVAHVLRLLREELEACMALCGCISLEDVRRADVGFVREGGMSPC